MPLILFPGTDQYTAITVSGLYDNNTESPLFAPAGGTVPTSGIAIGGTSPSTTGATFELLSLDQSNNALTFPGIQFVAGTAWDSTTAINTVQYNNGTITEGPKTGAPAYVIQLNQTTTITAGAVTFEGTYDNINWVPIPTAQILDPNTFVMQTNPYTFVASTNKAFLILAQGYAQIRVRLSTALGGADTGTVTPYWSSLSYEPSILSTTSSVVSGNKSNNTVVPGSTNLGVLPAIAQSSYTWGTYTDGFQVLPITDAAGALWNDLGAVAGVQLGATAVTAFGGTPAAVNVPAVNASIYAGTTPLTQTGGSLNVDVTNTVTVTGTVAVTQSTTPWVDNITQWASTVLGAPTAWGTAPTGNVIGVNSELFAGNTALTSTGSSLNVNITNATPVSVSGNLTNNNAAPVADNVGVLPAIAVSGTFPAVTIQATTAGFQELLTVSQGGSLITIPADEEYASHINYFADDSGFTTLITLPNATLVPLISIQSNSAAINFLIREVQGYGDGSQIKYVLVKNPQTLTGAAFTATGIPTGSHIKRDTTATAVTIGTGTVVWSSMGASAPAHTDQLLLALAAGAPGDTYTLAAQKFGTGTAKAFGSIRWSEEAAAI